MGYEHAPWRDREHNAPIRVLHIAQILQGGTASHLSELLPRQIAAWGSASVALLAPSDQTLYLEDGVPEQLTTFPSSQRNLAALWQFGKACGEAIRAFDPHIVHLHGTFAGFVGRIVTSLAPGLRRPTIYCSHGWAFNMRVSPLVQGSYAMAERALANRADVIICISKYERNSALAHGLSKKRLAMVYNGIADLPAAAAHPIEDHTPIRLVFVGRECPQKGFDILVEAMKQLLDQPIVLEAIGPSPRPDLPANVMARGWLSRAEVQERLGLADALVMPSLWEGFGLAALEAMRLGKAVVAADVDALPELVVDGVTGRLFKPGDPAALQTILASLRPAELGRMGKAGRTRFLTHFTADVMHEQIARVYDRALAP